MLSKLFLLLFILSAVNIFSQNCCSQGAELIPNGDFESTLPFSTSYVNSVPNSSSGTYGRVNQAYDMLPTNNECNTFYDHTFNNASGHFLLFNKNGLATSNVLDYTVNVTTGQEYVFSLFFQPDFISQPANYNIEVWINGIQVNSTYAGTLPECEWFNICGEWTANTSGNVNLSIRETGVTSNYRSFGIDDVSFKIATPDVVATQPLLEVCENDPTFNIGVQYLPTGNVYWTFNYFTPTDGFSPALASQPVGGAFVTLPSAPFVTSVTYSGLYKVFMFNPSACPPGTYPVIYSYTDNSGCTKSDTMNIVVKPTPNVVATIPILNLCSDSIVNLGTKYGTGTLSTPVNNLFWTNNLFTPVDLYPINPTGGSYTILPAGVSTDVFTNPAGTFTGYNFNPTALGSPSGPHIVEYTYTNSQGCSASAQMQIYNKDKKWHQTTSNATAHPNNGDKGIDIFTDGDFIYSTGSFQHKTSFDDGLGNTISITSLQPDLNNFYAVCYNTCGELQWVIYDEYGGVSNNWSEGFGICKEGDEILIGLNYNMKTTLKTVYPTPSTSLSLFNGVLGSSTIGNIAVISVEGPASPSFGKVNAIKDSYPNHFGTALDAKKSGSIVNVYISGKSDTDANSLSNAFASRLDYNIGSNSFTTNWVTNSSQESSTNIINDIKWDARIDRVLVTGTFNNTLTIMGTTINTIATSDAFFAWLDPNNGSIPYNVLYAFGIEPGGYAKGTCLASDDNEHIYFGGDFYGNVANAFGGFLGTGAGTINSSSPINSSYIFSYKVNNTIMMDVKEIFNSNSYTRLTGMDAKGDEMVFVGYYDRGKPAINGTTPQAAFNVVGGQGQYTFFGKTKITPTNWNNHNIINSTKSTNSPTVSYNHVSSRVTKDYQYSYTTGRYKGNLEYFSGVPVSGALLSSGTNTDPYNAFIIRKNLVTNELRITTNEDNKLINSSSIESSLNTLSISTLKNKPLEINTYPNPTSGIINLDISGYDFDKALNVQVSNIQGKVVLNTKITDSTTKIDISKFEKGVYFIKIEINESVRVLRILRS